MKKPAAAEGRQRPGKGTLPHHTCSDEATGCSPLRKDISVADEKEFELLPLYHRLLRHRQEDAQAGSDDGVAVDVPAWAMRYPKP